MHIIHDDDDDQLYISLIQWLSNVVNVHEDIRRVPVKRPGNWLAPTLACAEAEWDSTNRSRWSADNLRTKFIIAYFTCHQFYISFTYLPPKVLVDCALSRGEIFQNLVLGHTSEGRERLTTASSRHNRRQYPLCEYI